MTMTDTTTRPDPPAWLNLSAVLGDEHLEQIPVVTAELEAMAPAMLEMLGRARDLRDGMDAAVRALNLPEEAGDGVWEASVCTQVTTGSRGF